MKVYLDFDGVFIDSAFEAFRIALSTANQISDPLDNSKDILYKSFLKYRPYVGPAWNYKCVLDTILHSKSFLIPREVNEEINDFERKFFNTRKFFKEINFNSWISLHKTYKFSNMFLEHLKKDTDHEFIFFTNKNSDAVKSILKVLLPPLHTYKIISTTNFDNNMSKGDILLSIEKDNFILIDDIVRICEDVQNKNPNAIVLNADWGYSTKDDKNNTFVRVLNSSQIIKEVFK